LDSWVAASGDILDHEKRPNLMEAVKIAVANEPDVANFYGFI
jgi:hypothetical protein